MKSYAEKCDALHAELRTLGTVAVAFSGGVDSSVLLAAAHSQLGDRAVGVIADSPSLARADLDVAVRVARRLGARLERVTTKELQDERYVRNDGDRCYFCKEALFDAMSLVAEREGIQALAFGEIVDDAMDDRPGARSARERGVIAPLSQAGFTKEDVRRYAAEAGLEVADKPASACLASRLPRATVVTREALAEVERAEAGLAALGLRVLRVRHHGTRARVEVGQDEEPFARSLTPKIETAVRAAGFTEWDLGVYLPPTERTKVT